MGDKKDVKKKTSIFDEEELEELEVKSKHKDDKEDKKTKIEEKTSKYDEEKDSKKDSKKESKEEQTNKKEEKKEESKKESKKESVKDEEKASKKEEKEKDKKDSLKKDEKKNVVATKTSTKSKKYEEEDELLEDEETESSGVKIVLGIIVIAIIAILLIKSCSSNAVKYNVKFDANGGTDVSTLVVDENGLVTKPAEPTKEGYVFVGWYYNDELYDFSKPVTGNITLEARWAEEEIVAVSGVELDQTTLKLSLGGTATLIATVAPENAKDKSLTWSSSNEKIVTVDENGNVTAVKEGTATITVTTKDGGYTATAKVTVSADVVAVTGVTLDKTSLNLAPNESSTLKANVTPSKASNKGVTWKSSDESVATVSSNGKVTAKKEGTTTITATTKDGGYTATCTVTVKTVKVTGVKANKTALEVKVGKDTSASVTVSPSNATNKEVTWKSSDSSIATVDKNGKIKGIKEGTATITATTKDGGYTATIKVTVKPIVLVDSVSISGESEVKEGSTITLKANINPTTADDKTVTWSSSDTKIATVDKNGKVKGVKAGTVTITVTASNNKTATYTVVVKEKPATYTVVLDAEYTGTEISGWMFTVKKNGTATSDWKGMTCGGKTVTPKAGKLARDAQESATCTITLTDGSKTTAKATWVK